MLGKPSRRTQKKLEEHGKRARATVIEIAESGMSISSGQLAANVDRVLKTKLRVEPTDEPEFEVEQRFRYQQFEVPSVGSRLAVIYDPRDHDEVMIDRPGGGATLQAEAAAATQETDLQSTMDKVQQAKAQADEARERALALKQQLGTNPTVQPRSRGTTFPAPRTDSSGAPVSEDPIDKLAKLAELREKGMLTDAEFGAQKRRILGES